MRLEGAQRFHPIGRTYLVNTVQKTIIVGSGIFGVTAALELARRGHEVERWPDWIWLAGAVCGILVDKQRGTLEAGADPRRAAYALGW